MAVNNEIKKITNEINEIDTDQKIHDNERRNDPLTSNNPYLLKAQQRFEAIQWEEQTAIQIKAGSSKSIIIGHVEYKNRTVGDIEEADLGEKYAIWERLFVSFENTVRLIVADMRKPEEIKQLGERIEVIQKPLNDADNDNFMLGCKYYFGIPEDIARKNKEMLLPYIIGRRYLHNKAVVGSTFNDIASGKVTPSKNDLTRYTNSLTRGNNL